MCDEKLQCYGGDRVHACVRARMSVCVCIVRRNGTDRPSDSGCGVVEMDAFGSLRRSAKRLHARPDVFVLSQSEGNGNVR